MSRAVEDDHPSSLTEVGRLLESTLSYARERDYTGWDYGDGMSSLPVRWLPFDNRWLNLAIQETIKRSPVNVRPLFRVEQRRNFMGAALFAMANLTASESTGQERYRDEASDLVEWLVDVDLDEYAGFCGHHRHDLQGLERTVPAGTPGIVGTTYGVMALLQAADALATPAYADRARTAARFVFEDLGYEEFGPDGECARIDYKPGESDSHYTLNANALGARLFLELYACFGDERYRTAATRILSYLERTQTAAGGWYYRDPPSASHLSMDNHHNGFILETFLCYDEVAGDEFRGVLEEGVRFYRRRLFEPSGAPNYDEQQSYPRDVHAAAQGILVFTYADDVAFAREVLEWTLENLYGGNGRFYYRKHRWFTKRFTLMRWCQATMAYALSELARTRDGPPRLARYSR